MRLPMPGINQEEHGFVMVVAIMVLVILTMAGVSAIHLSVTELRIVRNSGLYKQNLKLAELAALEGVREILGVRDALKLKPAAAEWIWRVEDWESASRHGIPDYGYKVPRAVAENHLRVIERRGETAKETLRYYIAGWADLRGESMSMTHSERWREGRVVGVYDSRRFGRAWVEIGVRKKF